MMETTQAIVKAHSCFELPTHQRRLRHFKSLAVRNLYCPGCRSKDVAKLQAYFTLHRDSTSAAFYTSERLTGSLNPTWQSFDISRYEQDIDTSCKNVTVKVWVGVEKRFILLLDWQINFTGLIFTSDKLQETVKYGSNTVIFGMFDKYFMAPDDTDKTSKDNKKKEKSTKKSKKDKKISNSQSIFLQADQATVRSSYTSSSLSRIHTVLRAIKQNQANVNKVHQSIEDILVSSQQKTKKLSEQEELLLKVGQLKSELRWQTSKLQSEQDESTKLLTATQTRKKFLQDRLLALEKEREEFLERKKSYNQTRETLIKESAQLWIRRKQLINELATYIYPINEVVKIGSSRNSSEQNRKPLLTICNVRLPDSEDFQGQDDTMIAVALGYTCHLTMMISHVLDIPPRFPMELRGSRSLITDHIHTKLADKDREFPLYGKGKEKFQFNYGVFLLNKNISQLRFCCGLGTTDLRTTLLNLKTLLELRLGVKIENPNLRMLSGSIEKDRSIHDLDRTDGHSSVASDSRYSLPGSTDMLSFENIHLVSKHGSTRKTENSSNASVTDPLVVDPVNGDSEDIFQPIDGDSFFRVSSPAAERLGVFNDFGAIQEELSAIRTDSKTIEGESKGVNMKTGDGSNFENVTDKENELVTNPTSGNISNLAIPKNYSDNDIKYSSDSDAVPNSEQSEANQEDKCHTFVDPTYFKTVSINQIDDHNSDSLSDSDHIFQL